MLKNTYHLLSAFMLTLILTSPAYCNQSAGVLGWGVGLPYGGILGLNYELGINDYVAPTAGVGLLPDNIGWNIGVRLYYPERDARFSARLTALYGVNAVIEKSVYGEDGYDTDTGLSKGIGFNWRFGNEWAFDFDLFEIEQNPPPGYEKQGSDTKIALGFSRRWP